jgi:hypothetical protein
VKGEKYSQIGGKTGEGKMRKKVMKKEMKNTGILVHSFSVCFFSFNEVIIGS